MMAGDTDFILKVVAKDWDAYQNWLTRELVASPNVDTVRSTLAIRESKHLPGVPLEIVPAG